MLFIFHLYPALLRPGTNGIYDVPVLEAYARTVEDAYLLVQDRVPEGHRVWTWTQDPEQSCTMCGGPFHPATGHWESPVRHWCGPCARGMYAMLKTFLPRRWGKQRFYDFATPLPREAPVGWRPEDV